MPVTPVATAPSASRAHVFTYPRVAFGVVSELKERLRADLTAAIKARDDLVKATLRMTLTAIGNAEVAGTEARELSDDEVLRVINREVRKRKEAAEAFTGAGRAEQAAVDETTGELGARPGPRQMGQVMKRANAAAAGRADGGRVAAAVKALLVG